GYDKNTGKQAMPWLSLDVAKKYYESNKSINEFLKDYPTFQEQSLGKKPNIRQLLESGNIGLDCRYLNFAPQCEGWMQVTKDGGYGSFVIYWSKVWKLTTAATIPYYTGKYGNTKRGFGFVTIGANVDEFHSASNATKSNVTKILNVQTEQMQEIVNENKSEIEGFIERLINELSVVTLIMLILIIAIAVWMSKYLTSKLEKLLIATKNYSNNDFDYRINVKSNDEIGNLERSFNKMASKISLLIKNQSKLNTELEKKVELKTNELQEINKNLENKINDRTEFLRVALDKAKKADEAKSIFLANISHEIRTPLNAIIGFSDILANTKQENEKNRKYTEIIKSSSNTLLNIINDILDISKIQNGNFELNLDETNIHKVSESVIELFLNQAREKHIQLIFNIDNNIASNIISDSIRLKQVLTNLLSNAIKFTFEHGKVSLNIYIINENENEITLRFEVIDTGIGIPIENIDNIFQPFIQVEHKATREYQGTGLGLSICNHIVESFNSKINIESSVGKGTKLWFDSTFMKCKDDKKDLNNYAEKLKFKITSSSNDLISHIEKYLNIFGTIENENSDVLIYPFENIDEFKKNREINKEIPTLILFRYENDIKKIDLNKNEFALSLPFYSSNVNDSLQELLSKSNNQKLKYNKTLTSTYNGKVLVAEDNIANQELISHILKEMKVDFDIKENGLKCFESYKKNKYDLILMDINMPVLDGVSTLNKIREFEKENNKTKTPIIALTANAIKGDKEKFLNLGMNAYISKPINVNELNTLFQKYLIKENKENNFEKTVKKHNTIKSKLDAKLIQTNLGVSEKISFMLI
ncbi:ATP-binding protein, partial [Poseidonibacter sp.]|uniref:ATP-binding protein n=1 Tax=Poseidonibacter sp. TaxID=2321188 RepID=UPI003C7345BB